MKTTHAKTKATIHKISKTPTRVSTRIAAKNMTFKMEKNTRQDNLEMDKKSPEIRSPIKDPRKNLDIVMNEMKEEEAKNKEHELNEVLRDNPRTSRNNQNTFTCNKEEIESYKCQMNFEELCVDLYPSVLRLIENSDNDLAVRALHNVQKLQCFKY
ncbi:hypothetical protein U3516DRAFT_657288 [Neocallimastix sp. 'constans']|jgi:hypothetical protein